jgi:hypothetical protein
MRILQNNFYNIIPVEKTTLETKVLLDFPIFQLNATEADIYVTFYDSNDIFVERKIVHIPPEIYAQWGTDDDFLVDYVFSELNIQRLPAQ